MAEKQHEIVPVVGAGTPGTLVITIHGIGHYDASHATAKLMGTLDEGLAATLTPVDFNWCAMVEAGQDESGRVDQLSSSILAAAHLGTDETTGTAGYVIQGVGFLFEAGRESDQSFGYSSCLWQGFALRVAV